MKEDKQEEESKQQETEDLSSKDVNESEGFPVLTDSQFPNTQDLFGTQSSSEYVCYHYSNNISFQYYYNITSTLI